MGVRAPAQDGSPTAPGRVGIGATEMRSVSGYDARPNPLVARKSKTFASVLDCTTHVGAPAHCAARLSGSRTRRLRMLVGRLIQHVPLGTAPRPARRAWAPRSSRRADTVVADTLPKVDPSMDSPTPDEQLEALIKDHFDAIFRVAYSVVRDQALAEDVAQDAILKGWTALPTFRGESSLRSWMLRITYNTAIGTLRKRREELRDPAVLPESGRVHTEDDALGAISMGAFANALNRLDELSRSIVVLREIEGMSYEDIAQTLGVPLPTVKTRLLRARRQLAIALEGWQP